MLQGRRRRWRCLRSRSSGFAARHERLVRAQYQAAADRVLNGTGREAFDAMKTLKVADPARMTPSKTAPTIRESRSRRR
jgi:hypothetical protein